MRVVIRSAGVGFIAIVAAVLLAFTTTMASARAATALMVGGLAAGVLPDSVMSNVLAGRYAGDNRVNVVWPAQARPWTGYNHLTLGASVRAGTDTLYNTIPTNGATTVVVGMSAGALVVDEVLRRLATEPTRQNLTFMIIADSSRQDVISQSRYDPTFDYTYQPPPETKYTITVVTGEYDGAADFPDRPWNLLAVVNAMVGALYVHIPVMFANLEGLPFTQTTNSVGGVTKHYLVPTARLPLVSLMPWLASMEPTLKQWVDSGYSRNDQAAVTSFAAAGLATETQTESETKTESSTQTIDSTQTVGTDDGSLTELVQTPTEEGQKSANTTEALAKERSAEETTEALNQPDEGLGTDTEEGSNNVTDLTDGNKVTPTTLAGEKQSSGKVRQEDANQQLPSGDPSTSTTSTTEDDDPSATEDNDPSSTKDDDPSRTKDDDPSSSGEGSTK